MHLFTILVCITNNFFYRLQASDKKGGPATEAVRLPTAQPGAGPQNKTGQETINKKSKKLIRSLLSDGLCKASSVFIFPPVDCLYNCT